MTSTGSLNKFCMGDQNLLAHPVFGISIILEDKSLPKGQFPLILMVRNDLTKEAQIFTMVGLSALVVVAARESLYKPQNYLSAGWRVVLDCATHTHTELNAFEEDEQQSLSQFSLRNHPKNKSTEFVTPTIKQGKRSF